jgi:hypothetical protein
MKGIRLRSIVLLIFGVLVAVFGGTTSAREASAGRRSFSAKPKECYYGSGIFTTGACRDGQRCVTGVNDEDYWQDDPRCSTQTGSGAGSGYRQV